MSIGKKIAHKAEAAKGAAKKYFGRAIEDRRANVLRVLAVVGD